MGEAMTMAINTSNRKSLESKAVILTTDAPNTFRIPISLVRDSTVNVANPNSPKQAIKIAHSEAVVKIRLYCCSET